jgi:hypothetical protein
MTGTLAGVKIDAMKDRHDSAGHNVAGADGSKLRD